MFICDSDFTCLFKVSYNGASVKCRAVNRAQYALEGYEYNTENPEMDIQTKHLVKQLMYSNTIKNFASLEIFDESAMFDGNPFDPRINEFKKKFRTISMILDCVECEKCRLYSKLQILGLGTALKILLSGDSIIPSFLQRNEIIVN